MEFRESDEMGFAVIPGPIAPGEMDRLVSAYDQAVVNAAPEDVRVGSSTTRVNGLVNRGAEFDAIHRHLPLQEACGRVLGEPFRLSTMLARTLRPGTAAQGLHVDCARDELGWAMVGFIFMVDEFRPDNGATRFVPGSHLWAGAEEVLACGPAGSMVIYNGAVWHGHGVNRSGAPRRSIQGAFVRAGESRVSRIKTPIGG